MFLWSAIFWQDRLAQSDTFTRYAYWTFGPFFCFINIYFTWLLTYWYRQDKRFLNKLDNQRKIVPSTNENDNHSIEIVTKH